MNNLPVVQRPMPPTRPTNALHQVAAGIGAVVSAPAQGINLLNTGFATATNSIAQVLPSFPAATLGMPALGLPHAHVAHPPSGPPPIPPTPMIPFGPIALGTSVQVLINGMPAARCGDIGFNPTCCGLPPLYEIFTGSSKVFIGGARAARMLDITFHCKPTPSADTRSAAASARTAMQTAMQAGMMAMKVAGTVAQVAAIAGDTVEAVKTDDAAMSAALGMNAAMMAAQMAADMAARALSAAMGKDPCVPPGSMGTIIFGAPNVLIGGFPMPSWMAIARGLVKCVKGLRSRRNGAGGRRSPG